MIPSRTKSEWIGVNLRVCPGILDLIGVGDVDVSPRDNSFDLECHEDIASIAMDAKQIHVPHLAGS